MRRTHAKRADLLEWLQHHPRSVRGSAHEALGKVEREVRQHAKALAWYRAVAIAHERGEAWRHRSRVMHCPADWAAREFCDEFASDLRMLEPVPEEGSEEEFVGALGLAIFSPEIHPRILSWVRDLAAEEELDAWREVVRFTKKQANAWIQEGVISKGQRWDITPTYTEAAVRAAELLERDYALQAHPRR